MISYGVTRYLLYSVSAVVLSAFINGINISVLNATQKEIEKFIYFVLRARNYENSLTVNNESSDIDSDHWNKAALSIYSNIKNILVIGGIVGALLNGYVADRFGRKRSLIWSNAFVCFAVVFIGLSQKCKSHEMLIIGEFLIGINCGLNTCLAPVYLTEISPIRIRGFFGSVYIVSSGLGILVFEILLTFWKIADWVVMFSSIIIPSVLMLTILSKCEESPKYLYIINGDDVSAQNVLMKLRENSELSEELYELKVEYQSTERSPRFNLTHLWLNKTIRIALFITIVVMLSQQLTGMKAVLFFSQDILSRAGLTTISASYTRIALTFTSFTTILISAFLVDRFGRRTLLLIALLGIFCSLTFLTFCLAFKDTQIASYLSIASVFAFVIMFSCGPALIPYFLFAEIFRTDSRSVASSISYITLFSTELVISVWFMSLKVAIGGYIFAFFAILTLVFWIIILKKVPETNGKTVEEIVREL